MDERIDLREYKATALTDKKETKLDIQCLGKAIHAKYEQWESDRQELVSEWQECWAQYMSNIRGANLLRWEMFHTVGDVQTDYRHRLPTGKAFELVETVNSYLQSAFFPNKNWFDLYPTSMVPTPDWEETINVRRKFILHKLNQSRFRSIWDMFIRQCLVVGTSVLALPWKRQFKKTFKNINGKPIPQTRKVFDGCELRVMDMVDILLEPGKSFDENSSVIRRIMMTKGECLRLIADGVFQHGDKEMVINADDRSNVGSEHERQNSQWMKGSSNYSQLNYDEKICLVDFWGDLIVDDIELLDIHVVCIGDNVLLCENNPYWAGKPFVVSTLVQVHETPYGIGLLQPILGQLHQMFLGQNQRLDITEFAVNPMLLVNNDGDIDISQLWSEPGKIIPVSDLANAVRPLEIGGQNVAMTVNDEGLLEQRIDKTTGVGSYVGVNGGRNAERVTAEEVVAQRQAGGNRLGRLHRHLEESALTTFLTKFDSYLQQFITDPEVVRLQKPEPQSFHDRFDYFEVAPVDLEEDVEIVPVGAEHIVDKETELRQRIDFYSFVLQFPQFAEFINPKEAVKDLARRFLTEEWDRFVVIPPPQPSPEEMMQLQTEMQAPPVESSPEQNVSADNQALSQELAQKPERAFKVASEMVANEEQINNG